MGEFHSFAPAFVLVLADEGRHGSSVPSDFLLFILPLDHLDQFAQLRLYFEERQNFQNHMFNEWIEF